MKRKRIFALLCLGLFPIFAICKFEYWPLTGFPMYSRLISDSILFDYKTEIFLSDGQKVENSRLSDFIPRRNIYEILYCERNHPKKYCNDYFVQLVKKKYPTMLNIRYQKLNYSRNSDLITLIPGEKNEKIFSQ